MYMEKMMAPTPASIFCIIGLYGKNMQSNDVSINPQTAAARYCPKPVASILVVIAKAVKPKKMPAVSKTAIATDSAVYMLEIKPTITASQSVTKKRIP